MEAWAKHLRSHGLDVIGPVDHHVIYSVYFHDPNGIRLELTTNTNWKPNPEGAADSLKLWTSAKAEAVAKGDTAPLLEMIRSRRAQHKPAAQN